tara:strand:+ start:26 stop:601 length:576 start_codon:yes stop_codon:yes gene_type:complete
MSNLKDYILHLNNWIPKNILDKTIKELESDTWHKHQYHNNIDPDKLFSQNGEKEFDCCFGKNLTQYKELNSLLWKSLEKYILIDKIGGEQFSGWSGFTPIRFNRYADNQIMSKHIDHIHNLFTGERRGIPILSIVGVLNNNYEGGEFIMFNDFEIKFKPGDLIIFPSIFLYPHLVKPVTKGKRYSLVSWCY